MKIAEVGIEKCSASFDTLFSYTIPEELSGAVEPGVRVFVPFGRGNTLRQGFVFSVRDAGTDNGAELKNVSSVIDSSPLLNGEMLRIAEFIRERYFCTYFSSAKALLPGGMCSRTEKIYTVAADIPPEILAKADSTEKAVMDYLSKKKKFVRETLIRKKFGFAPESPLLIKMVKKGLLAEEADVFSEVGDLSVARIVLSEALSDETEFDGFSEKQKDVLILLSENGPMTAKEIAYYAGVSDSVIQTLIKKGACFSVADAVVRSPAVEYGAGEYVRPVLSDEQRQAFDILYGAYKSGEQRSALLFGVTGSGKTNVYLELTDRVLEDGRNVLVLVPEISLTPQTFSLFRARYGQKIAVLHSGLSLGERHDEWKRIRNGEASVVIGTRSAVFAPLENIGLIIIDEEQEHTYKSETSPRYSAKEIAKFRCARSGGLLVFASATPSIETYARAAEGKYILAELRRRYGSARLPHVMTVDMTDKTVLDSFLALSRPLASELEENLRRGEQSILLVNRRGYNTFVSCSDCKKVLSCPNCSISLTYHAANNRLMCHYCGYSIPYTEKCPDCGAENIRYSGCGTQRVERELQMRFPQARVLRMDADTTSAKNAHDRLLSAFAAGEYDILLGTQMVAKGLDFPNVTLVGIMSADRELYNDDFRCTERTFDLITQVVGRAGRSGGSGRAVIQTVTPDNDIIATASEQDYLKYYRSEIALRRAMIYPPYCDICLVGFAGRERGVVELCAEEYLRELKRLNGSVYADLRMIILGPMMPKVPKVNNSYRMRIIIKSKNTARFRDFIRAATERVYGDKTFRDVTIFADINPENMN